MKGKYAFLPNALHTSRIFVAAAEWELSCRNIS